jgi:branched-chain amino acid aminotransferase
MKAYKDNQDAVWLFRPDENYAFQQLCSKNGNARSSGRCFMEGLNQLLKLDEAWIKKRKRKHLYIRPFMIATGQGVIASPSDDYKFMIILSPAKSYYSGEVKY